jgi:hypothetical protein
LSLSECLGLEISVFEVYYHVVEHDDWGIDMVMRMGVNESRDEVSTFEDMNNILDTFEYEVDVAGNLEGMDSGSGRYPVCRFLKVIRMMVLQVVYMI